MAMLFPRFVMNFMENSLTDDDGFDNISKVI